MMMKKFTAGIVSLGLMTIGAFAANNASDNASTTNYPGGTWNTSTNGGSGFGAWAITDGDGGHYIGSTGLSSNSFGLFNTFTSTTTEVDRPLTGGFLSAGQTFSVDLGFTSFAASGAVGLDLQSGSTNSIELSTNGSGNWQLNDGGSNFSAGSAATPNTAYHFTLTYNGGNSYSYTLTGGGSGTNFTATNSLTGITGIRFFDFNQGGGANFGFDNLSVVPEPGTIVSFLSGSTLLGGLMFVRRRRS
jgi:hypothetical protein